MSRRHAQLSDPLLKYEFLLDITLKLKTESLVVLIYYISKLLGEIHRQNLLFQQWLLSKSTV